MVKIGRVVNCDSGRLYLGFVGSASAERELCLSRVFLTEVFHKISFLMVGSEMDGCGSSSDFQNTPFRFNKMVICRLTRLAQ